MSGEKQKATRSQAINVLLPGSNSSLRSVGIILPFVLLFIGLSIFSRPFLQVVNILNILDQQSAILTIAVAGTLVLVAGGIDLSVGATYALVGVVTASLAQTHEIWFAVIIGLLLGLVVGVVNGIIVTYFKINSLIATLAMSFVIAGLGSRFTEGNLIVLTMRPAFGNIAQSEYFGIATSIWIMVVFVILLGILLSRTTTGRYIFAVGGNVDAARLAGIRVNWIRIVTFGLSGVAAAIGGIVDASRVMSASAAGNSLAFTVLAGMVVGGTSIMGGLGSVWRTVLGVLFIALIGNGFDLLGIDPLYQQITLGIILLCAVGLDAWGKSK